MKILLGNVELAQNEDFVYMGGVMDHKEEAESLRDIGTEEDMWGFKKRS